MAVADMGAGTGLFTRLFAEWSVPGGRSMRSTSPRSSSTTSPPRPSQGQAQIVTVRGTQETTNLPAGSVDLVFLCDVYHHLENHEKILGSIHQALRPRGLLVLVEFDRVEGKSSQFVLKHIRAGQAEFRREINRPGSSRSQYPGPRLKENFFARFGRPKRWEGQREKDDEKWGGQG